MSEIKYQNQVRLLLDILPDVAQEDCFAMHGGTALNLFIRDMPRLSVDIDLTYVTIEERDVTIIRIEHTLRAIRDRIKRRFPVVRVSEPFENPGQAKLFCSRQGVQVIIRGGNLRADLSGGSKAFIVGSFSNVKLNLQADLAFRR